MKFLKSQLKWLPEIILILVTVYYWLDTGKLWNPFAIGFLAFLIIHLILKNKTIGYLISTVFILLSSYLFLALFSDVVKIKEYDDAAVKSVVFGVVFIGGIMAMAIWMMIRTMRESYRTAST